MVFDFIDNDGNSTTEKYGSNTNPSGITTQFSADEYNLTILDYWTSPHTNCTYPSGNFIYFNINFTFINYLLYL